MATTRKRPLLRWRDSGWYCKTCLCRRAHLCRKLHEGLHRGPNLEKDISARRREIPFYLVLLYQSILSYAVPYRITSQVFVFTSLNLIKLYLILPYHTIVYHRILLRIEYSMSCFLACHMMMSSAMIREILPCMLYHIALHCRLLHCILLYNVVQCCLHFVFIYYMADIIWYHFLSSNIQLYNDLHYIIFEFLYHVMFHYNTLRGIILGYSMILCYLVSYCLRYITSYHIISHHIISCCFIL